MFFSYLLMVCILIYFFYLMFGSIGGYFMINLLSCIKYLKLIVLDIYIFYYIMRNDRNNVK